MKKIFLLVTFILLSIAGFAQGFKTGGIFLRVTDSATYVNSDYVTAAHVDNYADIFYSVSSGLFWKWNGSSYELLSSGSGAAFWPLGGIANLTGHVTIQSTPGDYGIFLGDAINNLAGFEVFNAGNTFMVSNTATIEGSGKMTFRSSGGAGKVNLEANDSINLIAPAVKITSVPIADTTAYLMAWRAADSVLVRRNVSTISGGGGHVIEEEGTPLTARSKLNFVGAGVTATDDSGDDATDVTIPGVIGAQDLFITGPAMWRTVTAGCSDALSWEVGGKTYKTLDFDQTTDENAQFQFSLPRNWNNGTITVTAYWTASGSGSGTVQFEVSAVALSNDDPFSTSFGTAVAIDDTLIALDDVHVTPTSSAITIGGTPADGDLILVNILRDVSDDTLSADARLLGIRITLTLDAATSE